MNACDGKKLAQTARPMMDRIDAGDVKGALAAASDQPAADEPGQRRLKSRG